MLAFRLPQETDLLPLGRFPPPPLSELVDQVGPAEMEGVFPEFPVHDIGGLVQLPDVLGPHRLFKEGILDIPVGGQVEQNGPRRPVDVLRVVNGIEELPQELAPSRADRRRGGSASPRSPPN